MSMSAALRVTLTALVLGAVFVLAVVASVVLEEVPALAAVRGHGVLVAREAVVDAMVRALPADLPAGAVAVLQPELPSPWLLDDEVASTWTSLLTARIRDLRPTLELTSREHLEHILREQRFANSGYASPESKVQVGRLLAARMLLLSQLREFRFAGLGVRASLEAQLVDVETGAVIWSHSRSGDILFPWLRVGWEAGGALLFLGFTGALGRYARGLRRRHARARWARVRHQVDVLAGAATSTRTLYLREDLADVARGQQRAWAELDDALDLIRRSAPPAQLRRTRSCLDKLGSTIRRLQACCERRPISRRAGVQLAGELRDGAGSVRGLASQLSPLVG